MIPHRNPDGSHNDEEHEEMEPHEGQRYNANLHGCDLGKYDTLMIVYIRSYQGKLFRLMWPMRLDEGPVH